MKIKEIIETRNSNGQSIDDYLTIDSPLYKLIKKALKKYAKDRCKKQRKICFKQYLELKSIKNASDPKFN